MMLPSLPPPLRKSLPPWSTARCQRRRQMAWSRTPFLPELSYFICSGIVRTRIPPGLSSRSDSITVSAAPLGQPCPLARWDIHSRPLNLIATLHRRHDTSNFCFLDTFFVGSTVCLWSTNIFFCFHFYDWFSMLLKGMGESFLLSEDGPLTPNIDGVMGLWIFRRRAQTVKNRRKLDP